MFFVVGKKRIRQKASIITSTCSYWKMNAVPVLPVAMVVIAHPDGQVKECHKLPRIVVRGVDGQGGMSTSRDDLTAGGQTTCRWMKGVGVEETAVMYLNFMWYCILLCCVVGYAVLRLLKLNIPFPLVYLITLIYEIKYNFVTLNDYLIYN